MGVFAKSYTNHMDVDVGEKCVVSYGKSGGKLYPLIIGTMSNLRMDEWYSVSVASLTQ